jgi:hypothetical protein
MPLRPAGQRLKSTLALLYSIERGEAITQLADLVRQIDDWLSFRSPIQLAAGGEYGEMGYPLSTSAYPSLWLLSRGHVAYVSEDPITPPQIRRLADALVETPELYGLLRRALVDSYLGGVRLQDLSGVTALAVVTDLLTVVWELDRRARVVVIELLVDALPEVTQWDQAAMRLKTGFERGIGDRVPAVRSVSAKGLTLMACGIGPTVPGEDPARTLTVLFSVPHPEVQLAALRTIDELPDEAVMALSPYLAPVIDAVLLSDNAEARRLASALTFRQGGHLDPELADDLESGERQRQLSALRAAARAGHFDMALLPLVLDAAADRSAELRSEALAALAPILEEGVDSVRKRVALTLLSSDDPAIARAAIDNLRQKPLADPEVVRAAEEALSGPEENRTELVELVADLVPLVADSSGAEAYVAMLRHNDPDVRGTVMRRLSATPPQRIVVLDELYLALLEHLQDPEPALRVEAARALIGIRYPRASQTVLQLAVDPEAEVRRGLLEILRSAGDAEAYRRAEWLDDCASTVLELSAVVDGPSRDHWLASVRNLAEESVTRISYLFATVMATVAPDADDPLTLSVLAELDERLLERGQEGRDLIRICHYLLEPPDPSPEHAARLASARAAQDVAALDLLVTLFTHGGAEARAAARDHLSQLGSETKAPAVESELWRLYDMADDPVQRDMLLIALGSEVVGG